MIRASITPDEAVVLLNDMVRLDAAALRALLNNRVPCSVLLGDHPEVQAEFDGTDHYVGFLGVLNGLFGVYDQGELQDYGPISARFDKLEDGRPGKLLGFCLTTEVPVKSQVADGPKEAS